MTPTSLIMRFGVDKYVVNIDYNALDLIQNHFHHSLKGSWATQKSHGACDPFVLPFARNCESCCMSVIGVEGHLPKTRGEVQSCEDGRVASTNFPDALIYLLHRIFVHVTMIVQFSEVLDNS